MVRAVNNTRDARKGNLIQEAEWLRWWNMYR